MASFIPTLMKAIRAKDDEFVRGLLGSRELSDSELAAAIAEMDSSNKYIFYDVLVSQVVQDPFAQPCWRWLYFLDKAIPEGDASIQRSRQALLSIKDFEQMLAPKVVAAQELVQKMLDDAIASIQQRALREVKNELARSTADSEPLIRYTVKH